MSSIPRPCSSSGRTADLALGTSLAVGNVDTDPDVEIIVQTMVTLFDGKTQRTSGPTGPASAARSDIGDVSGDGVAKIRRADPGRTGARVRCRGEVAGVGNSRGNSGFFGAEVADLDGAKPAEIIVGDQQWCNVTLTDTTRLRRPRTSLRSSTRKETASAPLVSAM